MRIFLFFVFFFSFSSLAAEVSSGSVDGSIGFFGFVSSVLADISNFFFVTIPELIGDIKVWLVSFYLKLKFFAMYETLVFSHEVAITFMDMINISSFVNTATAALPQDLRQLSVDIGFFNSLTLIVEAWITRLIYGSVN